MLNYELSDDEGYFLKSLMEKFNGGSKALEYFLLYFYRANMQGHLCIQMKNQALEPDPTTLELENKSLLLEGFKEIQFRKNEAKPHILIEEDFVYFQKNLELEERILKGMQSITKEKHIKSSAFEDSCSNLNISTEQAAFIKIAIQNRFCFLTGGPGTGKTYTISQFLKVLWSLLSNEDKATYQIALCAPTGKASAHLKLSLEKQALDPALIERCHAKTLHSALGISKYSTHPAFNESRPCPYQLIIVDESSMIDARLMSALLSSIQEKGKLILVGDPDQLPPVDTGQVLPDLLSLYPQYVTSLTKCYRAESPDLLSFAKMVKDGDFAGSWDLLKKGSKDLVLQRADKLMNRSELELFVDDMIEEKSLNKRMTLKEAEDTYQTFRILSPMRKGVIGVENINSIFKTKLLKNDAFLPIIITKNAPSQGLFNGDSGLLYIKNKELRSLGNKAYFQLSTGELSKIDAPLLPPFELAFALSIHKSQGSEFNEVYTLLPEGSERFGREVLYTAATRAKKILNIWGHKKTFQELLKRKSRKVSGINRLYSVSSS